VIGEPVGVLTGVDELALDDVDPAALDVVLLELLPQADSAKAPIKHAAATTRNDLGRGTRAQMLSCDGMWPNLPGGSRRGGTSTRR
jgi:hypothetical protein